MKLSRAWAMPTADTFDCPPIGDLVRKYLHGVSVDPFARNKRWATYTNDLNPETTAEYHMDALAFLEMLRDRGVRADVVIFDPPYSMNQVKASYEGVGLKFGSEECWKAGRWTREKDVCKHIIKHGGIFLHFGFNSVGMGAQRGFQEEELLIATHGPGHYDTLCLVEKKVAEQMELAA
jgi:hypothetical protein